MNPESAGPCGQEILLTLRFHEDIVWAGGGLIPWGLQISVVTTCMLLSEYTVHPKSPLRSKTHFGKKFEFELFGSAWDRETEAHFTLIHFE